LISSVFFTLGNIFTAHITANLAPASATAVRGRHWRFRSSSLLWRRGGYLAHRPRLEQARRSLGAAGAWRSVCPAGCGSDFQRPHAAIHQPAWLDRCVAAMMAVSAMAYQYALLRLALPKVVSTSVMTGNLTNAVLSLVEMLLARGSFEAADFGTEKLVAFIGRLSGRLSGGCRRLLCARLNLAIADRPGGARACGAIVDPSPMLRAYVTRKRPRAFRQPK
jgi:hypothetical protein